MLTNYRNQYKSYKYGCCLVFEPLHPVDLMLTAVVEVCSPFDELCVSIERRRFSSQVGSVEECICELSSLACILFGYLAYNL